jgi:hypothetical protein
VDYGELGCIVEGVQIICHDGLMAQFNHLSPAIERMFRFVEMIGVTALLGVVTRPSMPILADSTIFVGTALAINYLIEPPVEWIASIVAGDKPTFESAALAFVIFAISSAASIWAAPFVAKLAILIGNTIN